MLPEPSYTGNSIHRSEACRAGTWCGTLAVLAAWWLPSRRGNDCAEAVDGHCRGDVDWLPRLGAIAGQEDTGLRHQRCVRVLAAGGGGRPEGSERAAGLFAGLQVS